MKGAVKVRKENGQPAVSGLTAQIERSVSVNLTYSRRLSMAVHVIKMTRWKVILRQPDPKTYGLDLV